MKEAGVAIDYVLEIDVPFDAIIERMSGRRVHVASGRTYHVKYNPPKVDNVDDETGEALIQRDDDKEDTVRKRLDVYSQQTRPLVDYYSDWAAKGDAPPRWLRRSTARSQAWAAWKTSPRAPSTPSSKPAPPRTKRPARVAFVAARTVPVRHPLRCACRPVQYRCIDVYVNVRREAAPAPTRRAAHPTDRAAGRTAARAKGRDSKWKSATTHSSSPAAPPGWAPVLPACWRKPAAKS